MSGDDFSHRATFDAIDQKLAKRILVVVEARYMRHPSRFHCISDHVKSSATAVAPL